MSTQLATAGGATTIAEFELSPHEAFRAEIRTARDGRRIVTISRWKLTPYPRRTGSCIEFAEHRINAIAGLLDQVLREIANR
jgi:hypothetical protein